MVLKTIRPNLKFINLKGKESLLLKNLRMRTEKKQLIFISNKQEIISELQEGLSRYFEVNVVSSIHTAYTLALKLLPDIILIDQTSFTTQDLKNLENFKSTHFLNKSWLIMYANILDKAEIDLNYKPLLDDIFYDAASSTALSERLIDQVYANLSLSNYWKDAFLGLFNLLSNPVVLLQQEVIVSMNDSFKQTFKIDSADGVKLTDFVNCENKTKVKASLRNFARGKHMQATTRTALRLGDHKIRNAKISFSKLDKMLQGQYIMMIQFTEDDTYVKEEIGSICEMVNTCFEENSQLTNYSFTSREKEIIQLLCKGYKTKDISDRLFISPKTIEKHRANIIKRTNSETILESIIYAINHNLIDVSHA